MVAKLSIVNVKVVDNSNIDVTFSEKLTSNLITSNVIITSNTHGAPNSEVLKVSITSNLLSIVCQPLTPLASYDITFKSVTYHPFKSINGEAIMSEDGVSNKYYITAPLDADNPVKNYLGSFFKDNIYNLDDPNTNVNKYIQSLAITLSRALYDIKQVKNENYLSFDIIDEKKIRGSGPFDRLDEESAYSISRVGRTPTGYNAKNTFVYSTFPTYPITLQKKSNVESLTPNTLAEAGFFDINNLVLNLNNNPVTKVTSIVFTLNTITPIYIYDIAKYGYQINDSRYDKDYGFTYLQLTDNQIRLSDFILTDPLFDLTKIISVQVQYESKNLGVIVDFNSVNVYTTQTATREVLPPIINVFNLSHAPIVNGSNVIPTLNGIKFDDPNSNSDSTHPAFKFEIPFRFDALPSTPGQYAVDYATGTVYVYGNDLTNDGTGPFPPLATYKYRLVYQSEIDYTYDNDFRDLVALPTGSLVNNSGNVEFTYEEVLVPGIDYNSNLHSEVLSERIDNNLVAFNVLRTKHTPITNVFRIYNETSGEIYTLNRWSDDKIYFRYNTPPKVDSKISERATFRTVANEMLFVHTTLTNVSSLRIFKIFFNSNRIVSSTEDGIASYLNSSVAFSNIEVFVAEKWFETELDENININRLTSIGQYSIDYMNGLAYVAVSNNQGLDIGTVTYKDSNITPDFPHLIAVDDLYYQISPLLQKNKRFSFTSFSDGNIVPEVLDPVDEKYLNGFITAPYQIYNKAVGTFSANSFTSGVTNQVKLVRGLYEHIDLVNSTNPFNFAQSTISNGFNVTVNSYNKQVFETVQFDGANYFVLINENIPYLSENITYTFSIVRSLDSNQLWDGYGTIVPGNPLKLILSGINTPLTGDQVNINYSFTIKELSRVIVDYNKGDYFIDYTYLADEIIISYEYGDNVIDFRKNKNLPTNTDYFVTYKAGALRDALLKNFGTLVNIPELANFNIDFDRERYRDALTAALTSFIQGPTIAAIKNIGKTISHIEPQVIESAFLNWSLGSSLLVPEDLTTTGSFESEPVKYGTGLIVNKPGQTIKFPINSNIRFEEGTFETWIRPKWNGLDNDATLTFTILKDGYTIPSNEIFIGASEYHPTLTLGTFNLSKLDDAFGAPNTNKDGVYIYYDKDISENFYRWYLKVVDGYVANNSATYKFTIKTNGSFYDSKSLIIPKPSNMSIFTGTNSLNITITGGSSGINEGITFLSDLDHYLLDFGKEKNTSRLSIYKDVSGYMNFRVFDRNGQSFSVSSDISSWKFNEIHHIAASWKLNTVNGRDEMHLFLDGFEVPNIIKFGQKLQPYLHEKFRTVDPEEIIGLVSRDIVGSIDLQTTIGSNLVTSSLNFGTYQVFAGDTIFIDEVGFDPAGYTISVINGQSLLLDLPMPITLTDARFSINRTQFNVTSDIDVAPNVAVTTIPTFLSGTDATGSMGSNIVNSVSTNFTTSNVLPGYLIRINDPNLTIYTIVQVSGNNLVISDNLPINISTTTFEIYSNVETEIPGERAIRPSYTISKDVNFNNILTVSNNVYAGNLILVRTLGLNNKKVKKNYYVWSDGQENVLMTQLPPPISLDEVKITKVILPNTIVGPSNSTLLSNIFYSNNLSTYSTVTSQNGRTISISVSGNNVDFTTATQVIVNGISNYININETLSFNDYGVLDTINQYTSINFISVITKPINSLKNALMVNAYEKYPITYAESSNLVPIVRYSYYIGGGYNLTNDGYYGVRDENFLFSGLDTNNYLVINAPVSVAGFYKITGFSEDRKTLLIQSTLQSAPQPLPSFSGGTYQILNVNDYRSGLQNGYFTFEDGVLPGQAYFLQHGIYELEYSTYNSIRLDNSNGYAFLGTDINNQHVFNGTIDQLKIYSVMLSDTRIGETVPENQRSITKDYNSLKALNSDSNTLMLVNFDSFPLINSAGFYTNKVTDKRHFQSSVVINENFGNSLVITDKPIIISNDGILNTNKEGTIEFWVNPLFDSANDPVDRFYFDAFGAKVEEVVSTTNVSLKLSSPASKILNVQVKAGDTRLDYFMGGKIEIDTQNAIQEEGTSISNSYVVVAKPILQVISIKIVGDKTGTDYFNGGNIASDQKTIYFGRPLPGSNLPLIITYQTTDNKNVNLNTQVIKLNKKLPNQNTYVVVKYIPEGLQGDRISIFKDRSGYINFGISASGTDYVVRAPTRWARNTWHRVKASYKINGELGSDEMRLFIDGYQFTDVTYGSGILYGKTPTVYGASHPGGFVATDGYSFVQSIKFKDQINDLYIGTQYTGENPIFALIDNYRISTISRPIYAPYGEPLDVNYSTNLSTVFPVTSDLFTTYLMNFDKMVVLNDNFAVIKNRNTGNFNFSVNILDSFNIVNSSIKVKEALEKLIKILKPANSKVFIEYKK